MNSEKLYKSIIERGQLRKNIKGYSELHHIIPKCLGGSDCEENLVRLTAREHFIAHWLLTRIHPDCIKIIHAFTCMSMKQNKRRLSSSQYDILKKYHSARMKMNNPFHTHEFIVKAVKTRFDKNDGIYNPKWNISESGREVLAKRMRLNNPNKGGSWNHTSKKLKVYYDSGVVEEYDYMKQFSDNHDVSYTTLKNSLRNGIVAPIIKKMGVIRLEKMKEIYETE